MQNAAANKRWKWPVSDLSQSMPNSELGDILQNALFWKLMRTEDSKLPCFSSFIPWRIFDIRKRFLPESDQQSMLLQMRHNKFMLLWDDPFKIVAYNGSLLVFVLPMNPNSTTSFWAFSIIATHFTR